MAQVLETIAEGWEADARREDAQAEQDKLHLSEDAFKNNQRKVNRTWLRPQGTVDGKLTHTEICHEGGQPGRHSHGKSCSTSTRGRWYNTCVDPRLEQLRPETIDRLAQKAQAEGLSLDAYLSALLGLLNEGTALAEMSETQFEAFIEDFSKGSEHFPPLPPDFSRADIYTDHD
jgi:hypothetical protein